MKRAILALFCCASLLANAAGAKADPSFDRTMASRYLQAAQSGDDDAQFYLGALYSAGIGVARSDGEAFRWISRAADQGHSHAMLILAGLYATGRGVAKDNVKAYKWAYIVSSASQVDEFRNGSRELMGVLEPRMSPAEISQAKAEAVRWRAVLATKPGPTIVPTSAPRIAPPSPPAAPAPQTVSAAVAPAPLAASSPQPPAKAGNDQNSSSPDAIGKNFKKGDVDNLLDQVPQGLRKRFGF